MKMKFLILLAAIVGVSLAQSNKFLRQPFNTYPQNRPSYTRTGAEEKYASILKSSFDSSPDGAYQYNYETDNGIAAEQSGYPRALGGVPPQVAETVQGRFSWTSPEGQLISIVYVADENGYRPVGDAIPTPPPIPSYILRSIEYNKLKAAQPQRRF